jgi:hypothetical protein
MESDMPIELVAARLWSGTRWHYPNAERIIEENKRLRVELAALKKPDALAEITIDDITDEHVEAVEDLIGMDCFGWHTVKHRELLLACVQVIRDTKKGQP